MLSEALRLIRIFHDLNQRQASIKLGVSTSYISEIEKGTKTPTLEVIGKYAETFGIPASSILFFSENLDRPGAADKARNFVAGKVLSLLQFLEARSGAAHAE